MSTTDNLKFLKKETFCVISIIKVQKEQITENYEIFRNFFRMVLDKHP